MSFGSLDRCKRQAFREPDSPPVSQPACAGWRGAGGFGRFGRSRGLGFAAGEVRRGLANRVEFAPRRSSSFRGRAWLPPFLGRSWVVVEGLRAPKTGREESGRLGQKWRTEVSAALVSAIAIWRSATPRRRGRRDNAGRGHGASASSAIFGAAVTVPELVPGAPSRGQERIRRRRPPSWVALLFHRGDEPPDGMSRPAIGLEWCGSHNCGGCEGRRPPSASSLRSLSAPRLAIPGSTSNTGKLPEALKGSGGPQSDLAPGDLAAFENTLALLADN